MHICTIFGLVPFFVEQLIYFPVICPTYQRFTSESVKCKLRIARSEKKYNLRHGRWSTFLSAMLIEFQYHLQEEYLCHSSVGMVSKLADESSTAHNHLPLMHLQKDLSRDMLLFHNSSLQCISQCLQRWTYEAYELSVCFLSKL